MNRSPRGRSWCRRALVGAAWSAVAIGASYPAYAQGYLSNNPSVVVDLGVLDSLGPARTTTLLPRSAMPVAAPTAPVRTQNLLDPPSRAPVSKLNIPVPTPPARPARLPASPALVAAPTPAVEPPKPPTAPRRRLPAVQTETRPAVPARPPVPERAAAATQLATTPQVAAPQSVAPRAVAPRAVAPPRTDLRQPTQVPPPPQPPEAPALTAQAPATAAREAASPVVEVPAVEVVRPPAAPQVAALPNPPDEYELRLEFESGSARLPDDGRQPLQELVSQLEDDAGTRLQLRAYAGGTAETSSLARRLSLSRALAVRSYLIEQGVRSTRMDVRALGNKSDDGPPDRVDIVLVDR